MPLLELTVSLYIIDDSTSSLNLTYFIPGLSLEESDVRYSRFGPTFSTDLGTALTLLVELLLR